MNHQLSLVALACVSLASCSGQDAEEVAPLTAPVALEQLYTRGSELFREPSRGVRDLWQDVVKNGWRESHPELEAFCEEHEAFVDYLVRHTGGVDAFKQPLAIDGGGHHVDIEMSMRFSRIMILAGRKLARENKADQALDLYLANLRFGHRHLLERNASLVTAMTAWSIQRETIPAIQDLVHRSRTSDAAWRKAIEELSTLGETWRPLPESFVDDQQAMADLMRGQAVEEGESTEYVDFYVEQSKVYAAAFQQAWNSNEPAHFEKALDDLQMEIVNAVADMVEPSEESLGLELQSKSILHFALSKLGSTIQMDMIKRMEVDMLRAAIAIRLYYMDHARTVPDTLEELVPEYLSQIPEDLFAQGSPIRIARSGANWWLYSIGPDREDQAGLESFDPFAPELGGDVLSFAEASHHD